MTTVERQPVAVWIDCSWDGPDDEVRLLRAVAHIADGNFEFACRVADGTDARSAAPWKAVIAGPVSSDAAKFIVRWIEAEGGRAIIDDGYYEDDLEVERPSGEVKAGEGES